MLKHDASKVIVFDDSIAKQGNFFTGEYNTMKLDFDPLINGYSFFKWTVLPQWLTDVFPGFRDMTEKNFVEGFSISDIDLETGSITSGFAGNDYNFATTIKKNNTDFSIKHREFSGSPIRNAYQYWISGIRDPETGIATYAKRAGIAYSAKNHTGEICYITTRPDADNVDMTNIEFACYYTAVFPTKIQLSQFSFSAGDHSNTDYDQSFKGVFHMGANVDAYAYEILKNKVYGISELNDFDPSNIEGVGTQEYYMKDINKSADDANTGTPNLYSDTHAYSAGASDLL
jgi:hypothetical protein